MKTELPDLSLARAHPRFAELDARKVELETRLAAIRDERVALIPAVRDELPGHRAAAAKPVSPILAKARAMVEGLLSKTEPVPATTMTPAGAIARLGELAEEEAAVKAALDLLAEAHAAARAEASRLVCETIAPEHARRAQALAQAVNALAQAGAEYVALTTALDAEGVAWGTLKPIVRIPGGFPEAEYSEIRAWLAEAVADGHMDVKALPARWRKGLAVAA